MFVTAPSPAAVVLPAAPEWQPTIGHYLVRHAAGRGGLATVFRAWDSQRGCDVAIKLLHAHLCDDVLCLARFAQEAAVLRRLQHPGVVPLLDVGVDQRRPFLVLGWVDGEPLSALLQRRRRLRLMEALGLAQQLASTLAHVHGQRTLHRDLKPSNLMVAKRSTLPQQRPGSKPMPRLRLIDFGIALGLDDPAGPADAPGRVLGSPGYLSPEQARGALLDARSDLFNVGLLLWRMVTGAAPRPQQLPPRRWPPAVAALVRRCLAQRPAARWASAVDLAQALGDLQCVLARPCVVFGPAATPHVSGSCDAVPARNRHRASPRR